MATGLMTDEELAMTYAIEQLAKPDIRLVGTILHSLRGGRYPGATVSVDWPVFLGCSRERLDQVIADRVAFYVAEREDDERRLGVQGTG